MVVRLYLINNKGDTIYVDFPNREELNRCFRVWKKNGGIERNHVERILIKEIQ